MINKKLTEKHMGIIAFFLSMLFIIAMAGSCTAGDSATIIYSGNLQGNVTPCFS